MSTNSLHLNSKINRERIIRIAIISSIVIFAQNVLPAPKAEANIFYDVASVVSSNLVWDVAKSACGTRCAVPAAVANVVVVKYAPVVAEKTVEYAKPGILEMFTNWGSTYLRP